MRKERVILGENCCYSADSKVTGLNNNRVIVGGSGSGKTVSILEPEIIELLRNRSSNMIVVATKRRLVDKYSYPLRKAGYRVYDLNFAEPEKSNCCYNPLKYVRIEEDIMDLASSIVFANERKENSRQDPFWDDTVISMLSAECALALEEGLGSFADVIAMQNALRFKNASGSGIETSLDKNFAKVMEKNPNSCAEKYWRTFQENPEKTAKCVYTALNTSIDKLFTFGICEQMKTKAAKEGSLVLQYTNENDAVNKIVEYLSGRIDSRDDIYTILLRFGNAFPATDKSGYKNVSAMRKSIIDAVGRKTRNRDCRNCEE